MRQPATVAEVLAHDPTFALDEKGDPITRERKCLCGRSYTQRLVSSRLMRLVETRGDSGFAAFTKQIPDGYVPVHCPSCERRDLERQTRTWAVA